MKRWDKGSELRITVRLSLRLFFFFFAVMNPTFKHAPWKESTINRSADDLELFVVVIGSSHRRRAKSSLGTVLMKIYLHGKGLTPRACMGDGGSIWWAPVLYHYVKLRNKMTRRERKEDSKPCVTSVTIILLSKIHLPFAKDQKTLMLSEDYDKTCKVIALSRLSHTNILPSSSSCRPVA